jgi:20S proteasome subunit beta 2
MDALHDPEFDNFDASLAPRNAMLASKGAPSSKYKKTGTTIAGLVFRDGVVIGADTRATAGSVVADKNCAKLHYISPNIYCAGAGTAADTDHVTKSVSYKLELLRLQTGRQSRIISAVTKLHDHLFRYGGNIGAYLILGGVDPTGKWLYGVSAEGTFKHQPYITLGSGSYCAMAEFEASYRDDLNVRVNTGRRSSRPRAEGNRVRHHE